MFFLLFKATRTRPRPWWAFWQQRSAADVYAWIALDSVDEARARAHNDMRVRGWSIDSFRVARPVDHTFPRNDADVRWKVRHASGGTPVYEFYAPLEYATDRSAAGGEITSRYLASPDVDLDPARVPATLRPLLRFANAWAIGDDVERSQLIAGASAAEKKELVNAVTPHFAAIEDFARTHADDVPVPDEVVVLNLIAEAADSASHDLEA